MRRLALLAVGFAVLAAGSAQAETIRFGPVKVHGWRVSGEALGHVLTIALETGESHVEFRDVLGASVRRRAAYGETHTYRIHGTSRVTATASRLLAAYRRDGRTRMRFTPTGPARRLAPDAGCKGVGSLVIPGRLRGALVLRTGLRGLGTMRLGSLPATRLVAVSRERCPIGVADGWDLESLDAPVLDVAANVTEVRAAVTVRRGSTREHPMTIEHTLTAFLPPSTFTTNGPNATFTGAGRFSGTARYIASPTGNGTLVGPLSARSRGLGRIRVLGADPARAALSRDIS